VADSGFRFLFPLFFRLYPGHFLSFLAIAAICFHASAWHRLVSQSDLIRSLANWLAFTVIKNPDINGYPETALSNAGVLWALRYEWAFYAAVPFLSLLIAKSSPKPWVRLSLLVLFTIAVGVAPDFQDRFRQLNSPRPSCLAPSRSSCGNMRRSRAY
jgi:peptidoglycan/LPS O-acetylase OafA/YrhL